MRLDLCGKNRMGLLSDITRVFRENGLTIMRMEVAEQGERAYGSFYVTDASGHDVNPKSVEMVTKEMGKSIIAINKTPEWVPDASPSKGSTSRANPKVEDAPKFSLGSLIRSQFERFSNNFGPIRL